ncbi:Uncharacterized protein APZ42_004590 [Daphnia magna]|uniref:Uncharacterized protein n=1 Tax=Daphnia magna TaxID=35525 RepID=A0A162CUV1_9CRUS|nr:Uncharacterized protein APZ42_004590 [Daphnia magna]
MYFLNSRALGVCAVPDRVGAWRITYVTRGPHSVQEVPDRVRPGRQFPIISRKPFALPAKQTPYTCPMRRALIIHTFIPPFHFCQNRPKMTSLEILQKSDGIIEIER